MFPGLKSMCKEKGYDLQVYDLHWGLGDGVSDDHSTAETCLKQLDKCLESSLGTYVLVRDPKWAIFGDGSSIYVVQMVSVIK